MRPPSTTTIASRIGDDPVPSIRTPLEIRVIPVAVLIGDPPHHKVCSARLAHVDLRSPVERSRQATERRIAAGSAGAKARWHVAFAPPEPLPSFCWRESALARGFR